MPDDLAQDQGAAFGALQAWSARCLRPIAVGLLLLFVVVAPLQFALAMAREMEPHSAAEAACRDVEPRDTANSSERGRCVERELARGGMTLAFLWPSVALAALTLTAWMGSSILRCRTSVGSPSV